MGKDLCRPEGHVGVVSQVPSALLAETRSLADLELTRLQGQANPKDLFASATRHWDCKFALPDWPLKYKFWRSN